MYISLASFSCLHPYMVAFVANEHSLDNRLRESVTEMASGH